MKVLHVLSSTNVNSGIANVVMNYYRNIDRDKVQFDCLVFEKAPNNFDYEIEALGGKVYFFTRPGLKTYFKALKDLDAFFKKYGKEYEIIHCHEILVAKMVFKYARKYGKVKCISHSHNSRLSNDPIRAIRNRFIITGLKNKSDYCFACSKEAGKVAFGDSTTKDKKFFVLVNAINLDKFKYDTEARLRLRNELHIENKTVLGNIGRLSVEKNQKFAIDVLKSVLDQGKDAVLLIVGIGNLENELKEYVVKCQLQDRVIFTGLRTDVPQLLSAMDYFVFPSIFEGLPVALVEAQTSGLECLCFAHITEEVKISDKLHVLSNESTCEQWADTIIGTKEESNREMYYQLLKENGFGIVEQAQKLKDMYEKILKGNV